MKVEDRHISEALRSMNIVGYSPQQIREFSDLPIKWARSVMAHALTLAKLECAVEALDVLAKITDYLPHPHCTKHEMVIRQALTQIRNESHE